MSKLPEFYYSLEHILDAHCELLKLSVGKRGKKKKTRKAAKALARNLLLAREESDYMDLMNALEDSQEKHLNEAYRKREGPHGRWNIRAHKITSAEE